MRLNVWCPCSQFSLLCVVEMRFPWSAGSERHCQRLRWKPLACGVVSCQGPSTCWRVIDSNSALDVLFGSQGRAWDGGWRRWGSGGVSSRRPLQCQTTVRFPALCSNTHKQGENWARLHQPAPSLVLWAWNMCEWLAKPYTSNHFWWIWTLGGTALLMWNTVLSSGIHALPAKNSA